MAQIKRAAEALAIVIWGFITSLLLKYLGIEFTGDQAALLQGALVVFVTSIVVGVIDKLQAIAWLKENLPWLHKFISLLLLAPDRPVFLSSDDRDYLIESIAERGHIAYGAKRGFTADLIQKLK